MKQLITLCLLLAGTNLIAQTHLSVEDIKPKEDYDNIHIQKISDDSLQTTFVIWVKQNVRAHYHAVHSENIYVVQGSGNMIVDGQSIQIKAGDYLNFPPKIVHSVLEVTSDAPLKVISVQSPQFKGKDRIFVQED